ncbi:hypothetical protein H6A03_11855 [[Clostridium] spiroforme]|nr:hypothetical protein [Thomasclavelia spiroformis]MBM6879992.1 hypothetical protein [Thomasclavelia spiroformis]
MNDKQIIGMKMGKKGVLINTVILLIYTCIWMFLGIYLCIGNFMKLSNMTRITLSIIMTIILLLLQLPMISATQRIEYSSQVIELYHVKGLIRQLKEIINILTDQVDHPTLSIMVEEIDTVKLSYRNTYGGYGVKGYALILLFWMKNGTVITLSPENILKPQNGAYLNLINMLEQLDIKIIDNFHLKDGLSKDSQYFQNYIKNTIDRNKSYDDRND